VRSLEGSSRPARSTTDPSTTPQQVMIRRSVLRRVCRAGNTDHGHAVPSVSTPAATGWAQQRCAHSPAVFRRNGNLSREYQGGHSRWSRSLAISFKLVFA